MQTFLLRAILLVVLFPVLTVQSQDPVWGRLFDTEGGGVCIETATSPDGSVFAFGYYNRDLDLGVKTLHPKYDGSGSYIIKMDPDGDVVDAFPVDGRSVAIENGKIDSQGNIVVCGRIFGSIEFNGVERTVQSQSAFTAKYSPAGKPLWIKIISPATYTNIALDESDNVYMVTTKIIDDFQIAGSVLYKYDPNGNLVFVNEFLGDDNQTSYVRAVDVQNGEAIVVGSVYGAATIFGNLYYNGNGTGYYVAKFNADGSRRWAINVGQSTYNNTDASDILYDADGGFFLSGGLPDNSLLMRYDNNGQKLWAKKSIPQHFSSTYMAFAPDGNLFLAADFYHGAQIDGIPLRATPDSNTIGNAPNFALIKINPQGNVLDIQQAEPGIINDVESIAIGIFGEVYIGAWSDSSPIQIGNVIMNSVIDDGWRHADGFVVRFNDIAGFMITTTEVCVGAPNHFSTDLNVADVQTISWNFGDPSSGASNTSDQLSPSHVYDTPGTYKVNAIVTDVNNTKRYGSLTFNVYSELQIFLGDDFALCPGEEKLLSVEQHDNWSYEWQDASTQNGFTASAAGKYWLSVSDGYCTGADTVLVTSMQPPPDLDLDDQELCIGESVAFDLSSLQCNISWSDGNTEAARTISTAGSYTVTANNACGEVQQTFSVDVVPALDVFIPSGSLCEDQVYTLDLGSLEADLQWNDGDNSKMKIFTSPGAYSVVVSNACERKTVAFTLSSVQPLKVDLGDDRVICSSSPPIILSAGTDVVSAVWSDGSTGETLEVTRPGTYWIEVTNQCEIVRDSVEVLSATSETLFLPNVITPNSDEDNEYFVVDEKITSTSLLIFNRWGERVYESSEYQNDWNGASLENGVYYYILPEYCMKGWVQIIR